MPDAFGDSGAHAQQFTAPDAAVRAQAYAVQGQTKERLSSREAVKLISSRVKDPLDAWLNANVEDAKKIAQLAINAATARQRAGKAQNAAGLNG